MFGLISVLITMEIKNSLTISVLQISSYILFSLILSTNFTCSSSSPNINILHRGSIYTFQCPLNQVKCFDEVQCVLETQVCDGKKDCNDGSDENSYVCSKCTKDQFTCQSGTCIPIESKCDRKSDCGDGSDERYCPSIKTKSKRLNGISCGEGTFPCADKSACIPISFRCDDYPNCNDGSDEKNCRK